MKNAGKFPEPLTEQTKLACEEKQAGGENGWMYQAKNIQLSVSAVLAMGAQTDVLRRVNENTREYIRTGRQWHNNVLQPKQIA